MTSSILHAVNLGYPDTDPFHLNDVEPVLKKYRTLEKGDVFLSLRNRSMVLYTYQLIIKLFGIRLVLPLNNMI